MAQLLLVLVLGLTIGAVVIGVIALVNGSDPGMRAVEPDGRAAPLPGSRPLVEADVTNATFDLAFRGYRMAQVDHALKRVAYDIGYKDELIGVLTAEVEALRDGRLEEADALRAARLAAQGESPSVDGTAAEQDTADVGADLEADQPATREIPDPDTTVPDGPFAPWPVVAAAGDGEVEHANDGAGEPEAAMPSPPGEAPAQKVSSRG